MTTMTMRPTTPVPPMDMSNPCTPLPCSRVNPFQFASCPPAPRARKRIIQTDLDAFAKADLFLPTNSEMEDENEPVPFILAPLTPLPKSALNKMASQKVVRPAAKRLKRRSIRPLPQLDISRTITEDEGEQADQKVRIRFRKSLNNADIFCKMWSPSSAPTPGPKVTLKRRNSCNAMCA